MGSGDEPLPPRRSLRLAGSLGLLSVPLIALSVDRDPRLYLRVDELLAWRGWIESLREWPIDASGLVRLMLYLGIPLASWVGGALVERLVDSAIG